MHQTAWTKSDSSFPSDRIRPNYPPAPPKKAKNANVPEPPKSRDVRRLESLVNGLRKAKEGVKDPKGGCFCRARIHDLSTYVPICKSCGLVLCSVNLPYHTCPHCASALLTPPARESLILRLQDQIDQTLAKEESDRIRAVDEARKAAGAFPTLSASASASDLGLGGLRPANQTHKVLSLNSKTKKVTVSSYSPSPTHSRSSTPKVVDPEEEEPERVPPPPPEVIYVKSRPDPARPWMNVRDAAPLYVPSSKSSNRADVGSFSKR